VGKALRRTANVQPHFLAVLHAAGPQAYVEDDDDGEEEPLSPALSGKSGNAMNDAKKVETGPPLSERSADALFEHLQTLERGYMPNEVFGNIYIFFCSALERVRVWEGGCVRNYILCYLELCAILLPSYGSKSHAHTRFNNVVLRWLTTLRFSQWAYLCTAMTNAPSKISGNYTIDC